MCLKCHSGISNQQVIDSLRENLTNPKFEVWNTTSIGHLMIVACGYNGLTARKLAMELLSKYVNWLNITNENNLIPEEERVKIREILIIKLKELNELDESSMPEQ